MLTVLEFLPCSHAPIPARSHGELQDSVIVRDQGLIDETRRARRRLACLENLEEEENPVSCFLLLSTTLPPRSPAPASKRSIFSARNFRPRLCGRSDGDGASDMKREGRAGGGRIEPAVAPSARAKLESFAWSFSKHFLARSPRRGRSRRAPSKTPRETHVNDRSIQKCRGAGEGGGGAALRGGRDGGGENNKK